MNIGNVAKDQDGFEDFNAYLEDDVFVSPPPNITAKPKSKHKYFQRSPSALHLCVKRTGIEVSCNLDLRVSTDRLEFERG